MQISSPTIKGEALYINKLVVKGKDNLLEKGTRSQSSEDTMVEANASLGIRIHCLGHQR